MAGRLERYRRLFDDARRGNIRSLYFLHGPEEHLKREFVRELVHAALPEGERTFNLDLIHGDEFDLPGFEDRLRAFPLFASRRVVILRGFDELAVSAREHVVECATDLPESLTLVVESSRTKLETAAHKRLATLAAKVGIAVAFEPLDERETVERVRGRLRREGFRVDGDALDLLIESVGTQLIDLANEVDKILLAAADTRTVDRATVASVVGKYRTESLFSVLDAVGAAPPDVLLPRVFQLVEAGEEPVFVVAMMLRRVVTLLEVERLIAERGRNVASSGALAEAMAGATSAYFAQHLRDQASSIPAGRLEALLENLRWADMKLKTTSLAPGHVIETALLASHVGKTLATPSL